ncbi:unnamed protein product [Hermetia illucens]|uniref:Uncharacterized protein n=1 Tax=Hermetia illucens TaxID=343691 RepID=A0A7R8UNL6_HERIL|nr:uncharacterized protein LOC119653077 [Hermetia illucens]CAD7083844.1 unnamed protein product [Hermetia illucens]
MKLAIVLLGLVALSVAAPQQRGIVQNIVQQEANKAQAELKNIVNQVNALTNKIQTEADNVISAAKAKIEPAIEELESEINKLIEKGGVVADCAVKNRHDLDAFKSIAFDKLPNCASGLAEDIADVLGGVSGDITSLGTAIADLGLIVSQCSVGGEAAAAVCAATQVGPIASNILTIVGDAISAVGIASGKAPALVADVEYCSTNVVGNALATIGKFSEAVKQCA